MERVNVLPNERVSIGDYEAGAGGRLMQEDQIRETRVRVLPAGRATGTAATGARIFGGFDVTVWAGTPTTTITISRGRALMPYLDDDNTLQFGLSFGEEGPGDLIVDFVTAAPGSTQAVYVRAVTTVGEFQNRVFWNPSGAPAREFVDNIATRRIVSWEIAFQDSSGAPPGQGEWVKIYEFTLDGVSAPITVADFRHFYYEGSAEASDAYQDEWGDGANDRSVTRSNYGVMDDHMWVQAVRRQLGDLVSQPSGGGNDGWSTAVTHGINQVGAKTDHVVTVDMAPFAAADYTTLEAAVTALNAANGGTILLRSGVYVIGTPIVCSQKIDIIGVEAGVILENDISSAQFMLTFDLGSEGSRVAALRMREGTNNSELQLRIQTSDIAIEDSIIIGEVRIDSVIANLERISLNRCWISGASTVAISGDVIRIEGGLDANIMFNQCIIQAGHLSRVDTIYMAGISVGRVTFSDCDMRFGNGPRGIRVIASELSVSILRCVIACYPFNAGVPCISFTSGMRHVIRDSKIEVAAGVGGAVNLDSVIHVDLSGSAGESFTMDSTLVDFNSYVAGHSSESASPIYISAVVGLISNCRFRNIRIWNATEAPAMYVAINVDPKAGGHIDVTGCRFWGITSATSGSIIAGIIGQGTSALNTGSMQFSKCVFDGTGKGYNGIIPAIDGGAMILTFGLSTSLKVADNYFFGGTWFAAVSTAVLAPQSSIECVGNHFLFPSPPLNMPYIAYLGAKPAEGAEGRCVFSNNFVLHGDHSVITDIVVLLNGFCVVSKNNWISNTTANVPTLGSLHFLAASYILAGGNLLDDPLIEGAAPVASSYTGGTLVY